MTVYTVVCCVVERPRPATDYAQARVLRLYDTGRWRCAVVTSKVVAPRVGANVSLASPWWHMKIWVHPNGISIRLCSV